MRAFSQQATTSSLALFKPCLQRIRPLLIKSALSRAAAQPQHDIFLTISDPKALTISKSSVKPAISYPPKHLKEHLSISEREEKVISTGKRDSEIPQGPHTIYTDVFTTNITMTTWVSCKKDVGKMSLSFFQNVISLRIIIEIFHPY